MSEISKIVQKRPNLFAKDADVIKELSTYYLKKDENSRQISEAPSKKMFNFGGSGGIPIHYDREQGRVYADSSDKHTIIIGSTASKKSRLVAMPTAMILGAAGESMIISDPKAEIYLRTASYLKSKGYIVEVLNLRDPQCGSAWNPLYVPYLMYQEGQIDRAYEFANDIAVNLTNIGKSEKEEFWDNSAGSFLFGLILLLFKYCKEHDEPPESVNIGNIIKLRNLLCSGNSNAIRNNPMWAYAKSDYFISSTLIGTIETANDTRAGILSTFDQKMRIFHIQPTLSNMLSHNNIDYSNLTGKRPTAVFLILPDEKTGYHNLVSLFVKQSYEYLIFEAQKNINVGNPLGNRVNYILDEFSSLPTITDFPAMITAARSRNIRFNLFLQSKHQLKLRYGEESETIMSNCENWLFLTSREVELLKEVSDLCGTNGGTTNQPLLSISDMKRLYKQAAEVLILSGRNKPYISYLADIDLFETVLPINKLDSNPVTYLKHEIKFQVDTLNVSPEQQMTMLNPMLPIMDIDTFLKHLDMKIKSLEEETQKNDKPGGGPHS